MLPVAVFAFGWSLMVPVVTLMTLDQVPERRGMASSVQSCIGSLANAAVAGIVVPLVMHSTLGLALTSLGFLVVGVLAWLWVKPRLVQRQTEVRPRAKTKNPAQGRVRMRS